MVFHIKRGSHSSKGIHFGLTLKPIINVRVKFDQSCLYDHRSMENLDINKLFGFSTSHFHHQQSARFGWRCLDGKTLQILTYSYDGGKRLDEQLLGEVKPDEEFTCILGVDGSSYVYTFQSSKRKNTVRVPLKAKPWKLKYMLYPYFGGNLVAPHNIDRKSVV
jgi:hypothetical protein